MSGNITLSLSEFESCNKTTPDEVVISEKCCHFKNLSFEFDTNVNIKKINSNISSNFTLQQFHTRTVPDIKKSKFNNYTNLPPPGGIDLLKKVQVFRL